MHRYLSVIISVQLVAAIIGLHLSCSFAQTVGCFERCMGNCNSDAETCRLECRGACSGGPTCRPGERACFGSGGSFGIRQCCPVDKNCCAFFERPSLRERITCCISGHECCHSEGCFDPATQQCQPGGIFNCPTGREFCQGACCNSGQVCTPQGCASPDEVCMGQRCETNQKCTEQGCCAPERITPIGCCPQGRIVCSGKCCAAGEVCKDGFCLPP